MAAIGRSIASSQLWISLFWKDLLQADRKYTILRRDLKIYRVHCWKAIKMKLQLVEHTTFHGLRHFVFDRIFRVASLPTWLRLFAHDPIRTHFFFLSVVFVNIIISGQNIRIINSNVLTIFIQHLHFATTRILVMCLTFVYSVYHYSVFISMVTDWLNDWLLTSHIHSIECSWRLAEVLACSQNPVQFNFIWKTPVTTWLWAKTLKRLKLETKRMLFYLKL
jgi:hypothetical protein